MNMDLAELSKALDMIGVPPSVIALGARADNSWCVERGSHGEWDVFWLERGKRIGHVQLKTEADACFQLVRRLAYTQLGARVIGRF